MFKSVFIQKQNSPMFFSGKFELWTKKKSDKCYRKFSGKTRIWYLMLLDADHFFNIRGP